MLQLVFLFQQFSFLRDAKRRNLSLNRDINDILQNEAEEMLHQWEEDSMTYHQIATAHQCRYNTVRK